MAAGLQMKTLAARKQNYSHVPGDIKVTSDI
jgi:hypothetical protein